MSSTSSSTSGVSASTVGSLISVSGLGSGLDINSIVAALVKAEGAPKTELQNEVTTHQNNITLYQALNTKMTAVQTAAQSMNIPYQWRAYTATSTDSSVSATANSGAVTGSLSFIVKSLAQAQVSASYGSVASADTVVGTGSLLLGQTGSLGIGTIKGSGLTTGAHTLAVTQASAGANANGTPVASSVTFTGSETLQVNVDGSPQTITMAAGTYNQQQLAQMVTSQSGGSLNVTVNSDKSLNIATTHEGSAASLQITGGTALTAMGLSAGSISNGTDGIVTVDGVANTVTSVMPDGSSPATLNGTAGTVTASFSGGLRVGSSTVQNIDLGDGKLSTVVTNINNANAGVLAAAVQVAPGQFKLQLQSTATGTAGAIGTDPNAFASTLGTIDTVTQGSDAKIQIGSGANAYSVTSSSNSISGVMPGVTLQLSSADPSKTVTVNVAGDVNTLSNNVQNLVNSVNDALKFISQNSTYDTTTGTAGALLGDYTAQSLQSQLMNAMSSLVGGSSLKAMGSIGLTIQSDGTIGFDQTKFASAYQSDPNSVVSLFIQGGLVGGSDGTQPGIAQRLVSMTHSAVDQVTGSLTTAINGENSTITDLNTQIDAWTLRLNDYQTMLTQQYTAMDTAVSQYKSTSSWLTSQAASLSANG